MAEDKIADVCSYLGHSFPASDIPAQARALYARNAFRLIPDARYTQCRIVPGTDTKTGEPIDLSDAVQRSVSPVHCEYLANMGVVGSMSVSVIKDGALWALVACRHRTARFVSYGVRQGCELLTQAVAWYLDTSERISFARAIESVRAQETAVMTGASGNRDCRGVLQNIAPALLDQAGAQGLALSHATDTWTAGITPSTAQIMDIVGWLSAGGEQALFTDCLSEQCPAANGTASVASGMAAIRLPSGWLLWFWAEWPRTIRWAGDPAKPIAMSGRINPRKSFQTWLEEVRGQSRPWDPWEQVTVTEVAHLITRLMFQDLEQSRLELERRTNRLPGERARDLEREVAERSAAVVASEARLADTIETLPDALILFDAEDRVVVCNAAFRTFFSVSEQYFKPGTNYEELARTTFGNEMVTAEGEAPDRWQQDRSAQRRAVGSQAVRTEYRRADGRWIELHDRRTQDGSLITMRIDVTEARRHEAVLAEQAKLAALGQLASGVAHEINNLL